MAFSNGLRSPPNESSLTNAYASPIRPIGSQLSSNATSTTTAERQQLHRRFTTNALPTLPTLSSLGPLSPIGQQRQQAANPSGDLAAQTFQKIQLLQKRRDEYEALKEQRNRFQRELDSFDAINSQELQRLEQDISRLSMPGYQSEPTTPPEYRDSGLGNGNRVNRHSFASIASTPGIGSIASPRAVRSGSQSIHTPFTSGTTMPSISLPQSRRGSDEEKDAILNLDFHNTPRRSNGINRNSMPAMPSRPFDVSQMQPDVNSVLGINNINSLLHEDDDDAIPSHIINGITESMNSLHMETNGDGFPLLRRRDTDHGLSSDDRQSNGHSNVHRHRAGQQSLPWNTLRNSQIEDSDNSFFDMPSKSNSQNRHSMEVYSGAFTGTGSKRSSLQALPSAFPGKLQQSYSTNDIPTMKNVPLREPATNGTGANLTHAEQHLHNHNNSLGRFPAPGTTRRGQETSIVDQQRSEGSSSVSVSSSLQPTVASFQNPMSPNLGNAFSPNPASASNPSAFQQSNGYYNNYNMPMMNMGMNNTGMHTGQPNGWANGGYGAPFQAYGGYGGYARPQFVPADSQRNVMRLRKGEDESARYAHLNLESMIGQIYEMCKDQHGCRFLQRQIEEGNKGKIDIIFNETKERIVELMTDPFGNYLCQKLLEYCDNDQRTTLINNAAPEMIQIALNQHGTRALQKMIEFISSRDARVGGQPLSEEERMVNRYQIETIKHALSTNIVGLIQDLNGNHVIQKCLNHLKPEDADFIFDEVARHCLVVGSHRHGCCVLQRCIDHAYNAQKVMLVQAVIDQAYQLVQDPFGNYVVQYILDLGIPEFTRPLCMSFQGRMVSLSQQKFSSNVMEKMIRCSTPDMRDSICEEYMTSSQDLEHHIRDMYTNYVIQTILDHGSQEIQDRMWVLIEPIMDRIRATPAGRRIHNKSLSRQNGKDVQAPKPATNGFYQPQNMGWTSAGAPHPHSNGATPSFF